MVADAAPGAGGRMRPLDGIRVLDFTHALSGPFATQILSDLGADVVKIENPDHQDFSRSVPPLVGDQSHYFVAINHGKRSVAVDLRSPDGRETVRRLAAKADVLVENFRPGVIARMGLDCETLSALNPRLIQCSISGFGQQGAHAGRPAYDAVIQGMSGFMSVTGEVGGAPLRCGVSIGDLVAGIYAVQAICAALFERERTGRGAMLDVPMFDALVGLLSYYLTLSQVSGTAPRATGSAHATIVPLGSFRTADGWLVVAATTDNFWRNLCRAIERDDLLEDERYRTLAGRQEHRTLLMTTLDEIFAERPSAEWMTALDRFDVPAGPVLDIPSLLASDIARERGLFRPVATPGGEVLVSRYPVIERSEGRPPLAADAVPRLGEHTDEVRSDWLDEALPSDRGEAA